MTTNNPFIPGEMADAEERFANVMPVYIELYKTLNRCAREDDTLTSEVALVAVAELLCDVLRLSGLLWRKSPDFLEAWGLQALALSDRRDTEPAPPIIENLAEALRKPVTPPRATN